MKNKLSRTTRSESTMRLHIRRDASGRVDIGVALHGCEPLTAACGILTGGDSRSPRSRTAARLRVRRARRRHVILFVAAQPVGTSPLGLDHECAEIQRELKMARHRDSLRFEARWAVGIDDLMRHMMELDPTVLHFSGHGDGRLMLQGGPLQAEPVSARALAMMIEAATRNVRLVVLNACYTTVQAQALRRSVDCVVGMPGAIGDDAARAFAIRFYGALGNGRSIGNAVAHGVASLVAKQLPEEVLPRCVTRPGVDADDIVLGRACSRSRRRGPQL